MPARDHNSWETHRWVTHSDNNDLSPASTGLPQQDYPNRITSTGLPQQDYLNRITSTGSPRRPPIAGGRQHLPVRLNASAGPPKPSAEIITNALLLPSPTGENPPTVVGSGQKRTWLLRLLRSRRNRDRIRCCPGAHIKPARDDANPSASRVLQSAHWGHSKLGILFYLVRKLSPTGERPLPGFAYVPKLEPAQLCKRGLFGVNSTVHAIHLCTGLDYV